MIEMALTGYRHLLTSLTRFSKRTSIDEKAPIMATTTRSTRRGISLAAVTVLLSGVISTGIDADPAQAYTSSVAMSIVSSGCTTHTWRGAISNTYTQGLWPTYKAPQTTGSVKYCTTKLRAADDNPKSDYYVLDTVASWSGSRSNFHIGAPWSQALSSSVTARGAEYSATPSFTRVTGAVRFSVGLSFAGISLSAPQTFTSGTGVTRTSMTNRAAGWKGVDVAKLGSTELVYAQAVSERTTPRFTVNYSRPLYSYSWSRLRQCRGATCWMSWKPTLSGSSQIRATHTR